MKERQLTPEELRKVQLLELKVLKEIKRVCTKHDIKYFLTGGTLIGAARHKGFVPWDDDFDICMLRDDYNRFLTEGVSRLPEGYAVFNLETKEDIEFKIVGASEASTLDGKISNESPIGVALMGAKKGETVEVECPAGVIQYKVKSISVQK